MDRLPLKKRARLVNWTPDHDNVSLAQNLYQIEHEEPRNRKAMSVSVETEKSKEIKVVPPNRLNKQVKQEKMKIEHKHEVGACRKLSREMVSLSTSTSFSGGMDAVTNKKPEEFHESYNDKIDEDHDRDRVSSSADLRNKLCLKRSARLKPSTKEFVLNSEGKELLKRAVNNFLAKKKMEKIQTKEVSDEDSPSKDSGMDNCSFGSPDESRTPASSPNGLTGSSFCGSNNDHDESAASLLFESSQDWSNFSGSSVSFSSEVPAPLIEYMEELENRDNSLSAGDVESATPPDIQDGFGLPSDASNINHHDCLQLPMLSGEEGECGKTTEEPDIAIIIDENSGGQKDKGKIPAGEGEAMMAREEVEEMDTTKTREEVENLPGTSASMKRAMSVGVNGRTSVSTEEDDDDLEAGLAHSEYWLGNRTFTEDVKKRVFWCKICQKMIPGFDKLLQHMVRSHPTTNIKHLTPWNYVSFDLEIAKTCTCCKR